MACDIGGIGGDKKKTGETELRDKYCRVFAANSTVCVVRDSTQSDERGVHIFSSFVSVILFLIPKLCVDLCSIASRL